MIDDLPDDVQGLELPVRRRSEYQPMGEDAGDEHHSASECYNTSPGRSDCPGHLDKKAHQVDENDRSGSQRRVPDAAGLEVRAHKCTTEGDDGDDYRDHTRTFAMQSRCVSTDPVAAEGRADTPAGSGIHTTFMPSSRGENAQGWERKGGKTTPSE